MGQRRGETSAITGIAQVMLAAGLWATVGISTKLVTSAGMVPEELLSLARLAVGGPALVLLVVVLARTPLSAVLRLDPLRLAWFVLGCTVFQLCLFRAFVLLEVTTTVFITVCLPPLIATALSLARGDRTVTPGGVAALGLGTGGLAFFTLDGFAAGMDGPRLLGLALAILASAAFVLMTSAARHLTRTSSPMLVAGAGLSLSAVVLAMLMPVFRFEAVVPDQIATWEFAGFLLYLGLGPTALAYVLYCSGMARCRSTNVGLVASMVEPAVAAVLAWAVLAERLSAAEVAGCALVMVAMLTLCESERSSPKQSLVRPMEEGVKP
jgi:drug/metabolite transporter, DME family